MYQISYAKTFRKMIKRLRKSGRFNEKPLELIIELLCEDKSIPPERRDHQLQGDMQRFRECHIAGDILLLYDKNIDTHKIILAKIGTHHEIFGN